MIKNILFYNLYHIGDTFFSQPIISEFCRLNNDYNISLLINYNWAIYKDIKNLNIINNDIDDKYSDLNYSHNDFKPENLIKYSDIYHTIINNISNNDIYKIIDGDTLCINTWIGSWNHPNQLVSYDCSPININNKFREIIDQINNIYTLNLKYDREEKILLPILPKMTVEFNKNKKSIFYYNYFPRSGQILPLDFNHHKIILEHLSNKFPDFNIYIPFKIDINCSNVIYTNIVESPSCENVIQNAHIAMLCDIVISYDIGSCFYYCNSIIDTFNGTWYHIGVTNTYYMQMFNSHKNNNIKFVQKNNYLEIINLIDTLHYPTLIDY